MPIKLTQLRDVVATAELGSLRAAARHLGIGQPAISRSIRDLENELGVALFERHQQGIRVTAAGKLFLLRAQMVQSELQRAREEIDQLNGQLTGHVAVAMSSASTFAMMPTAIRLFRRTYPKAIVQITECFFHQAELPMLRGQIDFFVGPFNQVGLQSRFRSEKLYDQNRVVISRSGHPLANETSLSALSNAEWVKQTLTDRASEADFESVFEEQGLPTPQIALRTTSATATLIAVSTSDLLASVPSVILAPPVDSSLFNIVPIDSPMGAPPICMVTRIDLPLTPLAEYLCDMIRRAGGYHAGIGTEQQVFD